MYVGRALLDWEIEGVYVGRALLDMKRRGSFSLSNPVREGRLPVIFSIMRQVSELSEAGISVSLLLLMLSSRKAGMDWISAGGKNGNVLLWRSRRVSPASFA